MVQLKWLGRYGPIACILWYERLGQICHFVHCQHRKSPLVEMLPVDGFQSGQPFIAHTISNIFIFYHLFVVFAVPSSCKILAILAQSCDGSPLCLKSLTDTDTDSHNIKLLFDIIRCFRVSSQRNICEI